MRLNRRRLQLILHSNQWNQGQVEVSSWLVELDLILSTCSVPLTVSAFLLPSSSLQAPRPDSPTHDEAAAFEFLIERQGSVFAVSSVVQFGGLGVRR